MSGLKRGIWYIPYDPTPTRLADLEHFSTKQDAWLERHGPFVRRYLGKEAFATAQAARDLVDKYIKARNPDRGFDAYGRAWNLFNQLYRKAMNTKQQQRRERQERLGRQRAVTRMLAECKAVWQDSENQKLLRRWADRSELQDLANAQETLSTGKPSQIQRKAQAWQKRFDKTLRAATEASQENTKAMQETLPKLEASLDTLGKLNVDGLDDDELKKHFWQEKERLHQQAHDAILKEDPSVLVLAINSLNQLATDYEPKVKMAQFQKATDAVGKALSNCGYSVTSRYEANGSIVLQATGFPFKSANVEMNPDTDEMKLNVSDEHGSHCVRDVKRLQAELTRQGLQLKMTDWSKGEPQSVHEHLGQNLTLGGAK